MAYAKQALIEVHHIYGTRGGVSVALIHKGRAVKSLVGPESHQTILELKAALRTWAFNHQPRYYINN